MAYPNMILFDYGNTLIYEPDWQIINGLKAIWPYLTKNPDGLSPEDFVPTAYDFISNSWKFSKNGYEVPERTFMQGAFSLYGLEFSLNWDDLEFIYFQAAIPPFLIPGTEKVLEYCRENSIRTAVVSNLAYDEKVLIRRLKSLLPEHDFDFVLSTANTFFRKPNPYVFKIAMRRAGLPASRLTFVGDNYPGDILPSAGLGMKTILMDAAMPCFYGNLHYEGPLVEDCERCKSMDELLSYLKRNS